MIIGQFCDVYPPETDGVGMVVKSYTEELVKLQHCCYYISPKTPNYPVKQNFPTFQYTSIRLNNGVYRLGIPFIDLSFQKNIKKIEFDIVHAHSPFSAGHEALRIAKKQNLPIIGTFHSKYYDDFYIRTHSKLLSKTGVRYIVDFYNDCNQVWAVNNATADVLRSYGYKKEIQIMPNGTNPWVPKVGEEHLASEKFGLKESVIFLFVGQHDWKKNIHYILEAIKLYSVSNSDFKMVFTGQGPNEQQIKERVQTLGLEEKVFFTGQIMDRALLMSLYSRADLFLFPSLYDNAPMVVREAAAAGTPSLLVKNSCAAEGIMHEVNGFLCEDDPQSIKDCIVAALPNVKKVGHTARDTIPVTWSKIMLDVQKKYQMLVKS